MKLLSYLLVVLFPLMYSAPHKEDTVSYNTTDESEIQATANQPALADDSRQKIIKTAQLKFETKDLELTYKNILSTLKKHGGYVQDDNVHTSYNTVTRHLTVRIPTSGFQPTLNTISKDVSFFDTKRISSIDVTEEFIDIEARLKAKRTLEKRYLELLNKAKNVKEILDIERELSKIREAIEAKQGRLKYLKNKVALSTIDIDFYKLTANAPVASSYGTKMWNAIKGGVDGVSIFILGILYIWPLVLIVIIGLFLLRKRLKKRKK